VAELSIWVPDTYRPVEKGVKDQPVIQSAMLPALGMGGLTGLGGAAAGIGSPYVRREELLGLWRRESWVRAGIRRIAHIAVSEGWEFVPSAQEQDGTADEELEFLTRLFEPEVSEVVNIRQWALPKQKFYVTFARLKLLSEVYWEVVKNGFDDIIDFQVMFGNVIPRVDRFGQFLDPAKAYLQVMVGSRQDFAQDEVIRFDIPDVDGRLGVSDLESLEMAATTDLYAQTWNRNTFKNNRTPPGAYIFDVNTDEETMRQNREVLDSLTGGVGNANRAPAFKGLADYKSFGAPFGRDQEYLRGRKFNRDEILSVVGTPAGVLGAVEDINRNTLGQLIEIVYRQESRPLQEPVEETLNLWLKGLGIQNWLFRFRRPSFGDEEAEVANAIKSVQWSISTPNEVRAKAGKAPYDGGDRFYMPSNVQVVGEAAEQKQANLQAPEDSNQQAQLDELRRWKRFAIRVAKGEVPPRPFRSQVLPADDVERVATRVASLGSDPDGVRAFFDALLGHVEKTTDFADRLPDWAGERYKDRLKALTALNDQSRKDRLQSLEVAEIPGL
jgi:hypothetical protein